MRRLTLTGILIFIRMKFRVTIGRSEFQLVSGVPPKGAIDTVNVAGRRVEAR